MHRISIIFGGLYSVLLFLACSNLDVTDLDSVLAKPGIFTDTRDGQQYETTKIGNQVWMAENLNYSGDDGEGNKTFEMGWCYGVNDNDTTDHGENTPCDTHGRLYTWDMVMQGESPSDQNPSGIQGICPSGWHLPSKAEWEEMIDYTIDNSPATSIDYVATFLFDTTEQHGKNTGAEGNDFFGFSLTFGGYRSIYSLGETSFPYSGLYESCYFWTASMDDSQFSYGVISYIRSTRMQIKTLSRSMGYSIRCVKD